MFWCHKNVILIDLNKNNKIQATKIYYQMKIKIGTIESSLKDKNWNSIQYDYMSRALDRRKMKQLPLMTKNARPIEPDSFDKQRNSFCCTKIKLLIE